MSWDDDVSRAGLLAELQILRKLVAKAVRDRVIPYPSRADADILFAVARALDDKEPK